jgi:hypothetical protein
MNATIAPNAWMRSAARRLHGTRDAVGVSSWLRSACAVVVDPADQDADFARRAVEQRTPSRSSSASNMVAHHRIDVGGGSRKLPVSTTP